MTRDKRMGFNDVLEFWFTPHDEEGTSSKECAQRWYQKSDDFDATIRERFLDIYEQLAAGETPDGWDDSPKARLARVIVLDQFTRNMFRGSGRMYASDDVALALSRSLVADLPTLGTHFATFALMPLMHAEDLAAQEDCVRIFAELAENEERSAAARAVFSNSRDYAVSHRDVVARFGRFPHRNALLSRDNTAEEDVYLQDPKAGW
ncbi:MAG: DUF924 family protein [Polyangiales bacterium]